MNKVKLNITIPPLLKAQLQTESKEKQISISEIIRTRLYQSYEQEKENRTNDK